MLLHKLFPTSLIALQIIGAFWYLFAIEREDTCWNSACKSTPSCKTDFLYCGNQHMDGFETWKNNSSVILGNNCSTDSDPPPFDFGIFAQALSSKTVASRQFVSKFCYCLWWGLQNLRQVTFCLISSYVFVVLQKRLPTYPL